MRGCESAHFHKNFVSVLVLVESLEIVIHNKIPKIFNEKFPRFSICIKNIVNFRLTPCNKKAAVPGLVPPLAYGEKRFVSVVGCCVDIEFCVVQENLQNFEFEGN